MADPPPDRAEWFERHAEQPLLRVPDLGARGDTLLRVTALLLGAVLAQILVAGLGVGLLAGLGLTEESAPVVLVIARSVLGLSAFLFVGAGYLYWRDDPALVGVQLPGRRDVLLTGVGFAGLVGLQLLSGLVFDFFSVEAADNAVVDQGRTSPELFLLLVPVQFLFTGPAEELLFRGVIQGLLRRTYGLLPGIGLASALFALVHVPALVGGDVLPVLAVVFLSGVVLGTVYEYTRNLIVSVLAHALLNTLLFATEYTESTAALVVC